jgi:hypothetical protein
VADQIESELKSGDYVASPDELEIIDSAVAAVDRGEIATEAAVAAAFARFSRK